MMPTLDRPRLEYRTPPDLVAEVERGLVRVPSFQRGFKWGAADVVALFDSLLRGFPIGNLLLWRRPAPARQVVVGPVVVDAPQIDLASWVVDGQQRITSLVGALHGAETSTDRRFRIYFDLEESTFHALGARQQSPQHWIPVSRLVDTARLLAWMRENQDWIEETHLIAADSAAKAIREYQIPTYVISAEDEDLVRKIFDRLNNTGVSLNKAEVFHALHAGFVNDEPDSLAGIGAVPARLGFGRFDDRLALRCVLAYRGGDIFREDFRDEFATASDRQSTFREVSLAIRAVVEFLRGEAGVPHLRLLPYSHVVPVLTRFVRRHGEPRGHLAHLLRRWIWRDAVSGTFAKGTSVAAIRQAVVAVDADEAYVAAQALLGGVPRPITFRPDLERVHLNHASAKLNVLGLLSAGPRDLATGAPLDLAGLFQSASLVREIIADRRLPLARTFANRVVAAPDQHRVGQALVEASPEIAQSYLVDPEGRQLLAAGEPERFLRRRAVVVSDAISAHVAAMAEWGARDGRPVAEMMRAAA